MEHLITKLFNLPLEKCLPFNRKRCSCTFYKDDCIHSSLGIDNSMRLFSHVSILKCQKWSRRLYWVLAQRGYYHHAIWCNCPHNIGRYLQRLLAPYVVCCSLLHSLITWSIRFSCSQYVSYFPRLLLGFELHSESTDHKRTNVIEGKHIHLK